MATRPDIQPGLPDTMAKRLAYLRTITGKESLETLQLLVLFAFEHDQEFSEFMGRPSWIEDAPAWRMEREKS